MRRWLAGRVAVVMVAVLALTVAAPTQRLVPDGQDPLPLSWLRDWFELPAGWGAPPTPAAPKQESGTAAGKNHLASTAATRAPGGAGRAPGKGKGELSPFSPHAATLKPTTTRALADDRSFDPLRSRRVATAGSAASDVYQNPDGSYTRRVYPGPVNFTAADGSWNPIDTVLAKGADGRLHEKANAHSVDFAGSAADPSIASLAVDGQRIGYGVQGAAAVAPTVSGSTVTYPAILPGTDLRLTTLPTGFEESLILHSASVATSWVFPLRLTGVTGQVRTDGSVAFTDPAGKVVAVIPHGWMADSAYDPRTDDTARSDAVTYELVTVDGGPALKMSVDSAWLRDPARRFPVTVDPTLVDSVNYTTGSTYAQAGTTSDHSGEYEIKVGTSDGSNKAYGFLQFAYFGALYAGARVSSVTLNLFAHWAYTCTPKPVTINPVTQAWSPSSVRGYPGPSFGGSIGSVAPSVNNACHNTPDSQGRHNPTVGDWVRVPLQVDTFNSWTVGGPNNGLAVTASQTDLFQWKRFNSAVGPNPPDLSFTYTPNDPPQITAQYPPNNYAVSTLTPQLLASADDDGLPNGTIRYQFRVYDSDTNEIAVSDVLDTGTYKVPSGVLSWGRSYAWAVWAYDGVAWSPQPEAHYFSTPVPQPVVTSKLSQNSGGHGFEPSIGNYTTSATDAQVATAGPALAVQRNYNSSDPRISGAFGAGWSSLYDAKVIEQKDAAGKVRTATITYPDGKDVAFGRDADGSFTPPTGRYATFTTVTGGGYTLTDKNGTIYKFTQPLSTGGYAISAITDVNGRSQTFTYTSGQVTAASSDTSGRALRLSWLTPPGARTPHVATVATDPSVPGDSSTILTWTYTYTGDQLTKVCPPTSSTACTTYGYMSTSQYPATVADLAPHSYWRLGESTGTTAASSVLANAGSDNATYHNVTLGGPGPLPGSTGTSAAFNGTTSYLDLTDGGQRSEALVVNSAYQSISLWFKTTGSGPLFTFQADTVTDPTTTSGFTPSLYVGTSGKLYGEFWYDGGTKPIVTASSVADGRWHHVVLAGAGDTQSMYLDGGLVGAKSGVIQVWADNGAQNVYVGGGFIGGAWPDQPHKSSTDNTGYASFFSGSISDVAFYDRQLSASNVTALYGAGQRAAQVVSSVTRPSGKTYATISYAANSGVVSQVVDENGGTWKIAPATAAGSSQVFASSVLAGGPADYWRLGDAGGPRAVNQIHGGVATYNRVILGTAGPFTDANAAAFDGTTSYLQLPPNLVGGTGNMSVGMWFKTTDATAPLFSYQGDPIANGTAADYVPALYVGADGHLVGEFWGPGGMPAVISPDPVNDDEWHYVVLAAGTGTQTVYLDGRSIGSTDGAIEADGLPYAYVGTGYVGGSWPDQPWPGQAPQAAYFTGSISDVAFYRSELKPESVAAQFKASKFANGLTPVATVTVTDPGGKPVGYSYDATMGNRLIARTDALGFTTRFGYDTSGFLNTVTDPNGNVTATGHDVRGNLVSNTTCQNQVANKCATTYYTYYPDDTSTDLTPDPRNDVVLTMRDGRSASADDDTYLTSYAYDAAGKLLSTTTPPVDGFPTGRQQVTTYTDGTTQAADGGPAPAGLPATVTTPGGAVHRATYFKNGDVAQETDAAGLVTRYSYDNLGRTKTKTVVSDSYPAGLLTAYTYDRLGRVHTQTSPAVTDRVTGAVHTAQATTDYDDDGNVTTTTVADLTGGDAPRTTRATYNRYAQQDSETDPAGNKATFGYDAYGNRNKVVDPAGVETDSDFDPNGHVKTVTAKGYTGDPVNPSPTRDLVGFSKAYDPAGRPASDTDSMGFVTSYTYTDNGLVATVTRSDPAHPGTSFVMQSNSYDAVGNLASRTTNNGATTTTQTFDAANRTTATTVDPTGVKRITTYVYSPDDAVVSARLSDPSTGSRTLEATYDPMGRKTSQTVNNDASNHPAGWWRLNESGGLSAADASGTQKNGTLSGGVSWSGGTATFDGSTGEIATNGPVLDTTQSFTVSAWVKPKSLSAWMGVLGQDADQSSGAYLQYDRDNNRWAFSRTTSDTVDAASVRAESTAAPTNGTWAHLVGVFNASNGALTLYVNGAANGTATDTTPFQANGPLVIGRDRYNGESTDFFNGAIANVQVYQRALSASDVSMLFANGCTGGALSTNRLTTTWSLDQRGLPKTKTDPNGNTTNYAYDEVGRIAVTTAPTVNTETNGDTPVPTRPISVIGYDTFGAKVETSDPNGNVTTTAYDADNRPVSVTLPKYTPPDLSAPITPGVSMTYTSRGKLATSTDALSHQTIYTYDQMDNLATVTAPNAGVTHYTYDTNGDRLSATDPIGGQIQATYDYLGRKSTTTEIVTTPSPSAYTTTYTYNPGGWLSSVRTPASSTTTYDYNALGETSKVTDAATNATTFSYDYAGRRTKTVLPDGTAATATYDAAGRQTASSTLDTTGAVLATQSTSYDDNGNQLSTTDARNHITTFTYDATDMVTSEVQPVNATTSITTGFGYDVGGHRTRFTDGRHNSFITKYNRWNLPESLIEPATPAYPNAADRTFTTVYDANGRAAKELSPGGVTVTNTYNAIGKLTKQTGAGADAATNDRVFDYDNAGRLRTASAPGGTDTFTYDERGLLLSATGPSGPSSFTYTPDGLMATRTDASGDATYTYDTADRLWTLQDASTGTTLSMSYNQLSQVSKITYGAGADVRTVGYNKLHQLTSDTVKTSAGAAVASITYDYDLNGNETSKTTAGFAGAGANTYTYDFGNRLASWTNGSGTSTYAYDDSGNRIQAGTQTFSYDARNELTSGAGTTYTYTARGTQASATTGTTTVMSTSDAFGQTIKQGNQTYAYDALGRTITDALSGGGTRTFGYSGQGNTVASDGNFTYSRGPSGGLTGIKTGTSGVLAWTDRHGDVVGSFAGTAMKLSGSTSYGPLGNVVASQTPIGNLGYQSGWTESATGRVNMGARWYNSATGQFDNRDSAANSPVPNSANANRYAYGNDNPLTSVDPDGHRAWDVDDAGHIFFVAANPKGGPDITWGNPHPHYNDLYVRSDHDAHTCDERACRVDTNAWAQKLKAQIDEQRYRAEQLMKQCPNRQCHDEIMAKLKNGDYDYINDNGTIITSDGYHVTTYTPTLKIALMDAAKKQAEQADEAERAKKAKAEACQKSFWCRNAGIIGAVAGIVAGVGCGLLLGWTGVGGLACGFVGGFVASFTTDMLKGSSVLHAVGAGVIGGVVGAVGAGVGGAVAGGVLSKIGQAGAGVVSRVATGAVVGAVSGGVAGGATAAVEYGFGCLSGAPCTAAGFASAVVGGTVTGAIFGAVGGAAGGIRKPAPASAGSAKPSEPPAAACSRLGHSFDPATPVLMADGSARAIKDIKLGDKVAATDPLTGKTSAQPVTVLHLNRDVELTDVLVSSVPATGVAASSGALDGRGGNSRTYGRTAHHGVPSVLGRYGSAVGRRGRAEAGARAYRASGRRRVRDVGTQLRGRQGHARPYRRHRPHVLCGCR